MWFFWKKRTLNKTLKRKNYKAYKSLESSEARLQKALKWYDDFNRNHNQRYYS